MAKDGTSHNLPLVEKHNANFGCQCFLENCQITGNNLMHTQAFIANLFLF